MTTKKEMSVVERDLGQFLEKHDALIAEGYKVVAGTTFKSMTALHAKYIEADKPVETKPATKTKRATKKVAEKTAEE